MLRVRLELVPYGYLPPRGIGCLEIVNDGTGTDGRADYDYRFVEEQGGAVVRRGPWRKLRGHRRDDGAWTLVGAILAARASGREAPSEQGRRVDWSSAARDRALAAKATRSTPAT